MRSLSRLLSITPTFDEDSIIRRADLPKIQRRDPALPDNAEPGDVVKIVRDSRTTDRAVSYRLVIE